MAGMLHGYRCNDCDSTYLFKIPMCFNCGNAVIGLAEVLGEGIVLTSTTIYVAPDRFADDVPYTVVLVQLDEGPRLIGRLKKGDNIRTGVRVICSEPNDEEGIFVENMSSLSL
ncbi:hypothetical protein FIM12_00715 [SAR202 cluster bacterium AD-804-J14_MRT_500m]|nr:hypothetical protein [SAR202 cluster bacterium AD-804-J14_MRT_500m]